MILEGLQLHIVLARSLNGEESLKNFSYPDPDPHRNIIYSVQNVFEISCSQTNRQTNGQTDRQTGENITSGRGKKTKKEIKTAQHQRKRELVKVHSAIPKEGVDTVCATIHAAQHLSCTSAQMPA